MIGSADLPGMTGVPWLIGAGLTITPPWAGAAGAITAGAAWTGPLPQLSQLVPQLTSQQSFFFLRKKEKQRRFGFSQQAGSQEAGWQQEVAPHDAAGAQVGWAQGVEQAGAQLTTSQQFLLFLERLRLGFSQQSLTQQSLTAPHDPQLLLTLPQPPPHAEATGAA